MGERGVGEISKTVHLREPDKLREAPTGDRADNNPPGKLAYAHCTCRQLNELSINRRLSLSMS